MESMILKIRDWIVIREGGAENGQQTAFGIAMTIGRRILLCMATMMPCFMPHSKSKPAFLPSNLSNNQTIPAIPTISNTQGAVDEPYGT